MKHIFVSCTFENMKSEREIIQKSIIPMINKKADAYNECIGYVDLRWDKEYDEKKLSKEIFDALKWDLINKQPHILVFVNDDKNYDGIRKMLKKFEHLFVCVKKNKKASNMAITDDKERVVYYESLDEVFEKEFVEIFASDVEKTLKKSNNISWQEKETLGYKAYVDEIRGFFNKVNNSIMSFDKDNLAFSLKIDMKNLDKYKITCFQTREKILSKYVNDINETDKKIFLYLGESGCGKSYMYANLVHEFEKKQKKLFPFVCKYSVRSFTASDLLKQMVYYIENLLGIKEHFKEKTVLGNDTIIDADFINKSYLPEAIESCEVKIEENKKENQIKINYFNDWKDYFVKLLKKYDERYSEPFIILLDCVEQLPDNELEQILKMIPFIEDDKVKCVMFGNENINFEVFNGYEGIMSVERLSKLTSKELGDISEDILRANDFKLDNIVTDTLLKKASKSSHLYLNLLLYYLVIECKDNKKDIKNSSNNKYVIKLIEKTTSNMEELMKILLDKATTKFDKNMIKDIVRLIAVSRNGLRESDIKSIVEKKGTFNKNEFMKFISYMSVCFELKDDGRYDFSHEVFKNYVKNGIRNEIEYEKRILAIIKELPFSDELRLYDGIYHAYNCSDKEFVVYQMELACIEDEENSLIISNSIKHICYVDEGKWLCDIVGDKKIVNDKSVIIPYLLHDFRKSFDKNLIDNTIRMNLMKVLVIRLSAIYKKNKNSLNEVNLISSYRRIGSLMRSFGIEEKSIECYRKALDLAIELYKKDKTAIDNEEILNIYGVLGELYTDKNDVENMKKYFYGYFLISMQKYHQYKSLSNLKNIAISYKQMGILYKESEQYDLAKQALELFIQCINLIQKYDDDIENKKQEMLGFYLYGEICDITDDKEGALNNYDKALKCSKKVLTERKSISSRKDVAISYGLISKVYAKEGKTEQALMYQEKSLGYMEEIYEKVKDIDSLKELLVSCIKTAKAYLRLEEYEKSLEYGNKCLGLAVDLNTRNSNDEWNIYQYSVAQEVMGDIYEAQDMYYESLEFYNISMYYKKECLYIEKKPIVYKGISDLCSKMGYCYDITKDYRNSIIMYQKKMKYVEELNSLTDEVDYYKEISFCYSKLSDMYLKINDLKNAVYYSKKEVDILESVLSYEKTLDNMWELVKCYENIANNYYENTKYELALSNYQKELNILEKIYIQNEDNYTLQNISSKCERIADLYVAIGRHETALEYYKKEFVYVSSLYELAPDGEKFKTVCAVCNILGDAYERLEQNDEAVKYYNKSIEWIGKLDDISSSTEIQEMLCYANDKIENIKENNI